MSETTDSRATTETKAAYRVLARKYRPHSFADLIGQEPMVRTLTNAFDTGRIAQAWMLTGVRGVGKTTTARILARALNYETETIHQPTIHMEAPGIHCQAIMEGRHVDVVEMDAASHTGIDDIREIIAQVRYRPVSARYKVYIIDEVHMLSTQAFNGLLKTLEEPPEHVKFVFATTEIRKVPITVLSRCQRFDLRRVESATLIAHLKRITGKESVEAGDDALRLIARAAEGSVRDALSLTDQAIAHGAGAVDAKAVRDMLGLADRVRVVDLFEHVMKGDAKAALAELRDQHAAGADPAIVLSDLADFTHLVTTLRFVPEAAEDAALSPEEAERGLAFSKSLSVRTLGQVWQMLLKALEETRSADAPRQAAEMALIRLAHAADLPSPDDLLRLLREGGPDALPASRETGAHRANGANGETTAGASTQPSSQAPRPAAPDIAPPAASARATGTGGPAMQAATPARLDAPPAPRALAGRAPLSLASVGDPLPGQRSAPEAGNGVSERLTSLAAIADLAKEKRDSRLEAWIRRYVRPVKIEPRRLEIGLLDETPPSLVGDLGRRLFDWTGERWVVTVATKADAPTLSELAAEKRRKLFSDAAADPAVAAVLAAFPGATIADVRLRGEAESAEAEADLAEALTPEGADYGSGAGDGLEFSGDDDDIGMSDRDFADPSDDEEF